MELSAIKTTVSVVVVVVATRDELAVVVHDEPVTIAWKRQSSLLGKIPQVEICPLPNLLLHLWRN